MRIIKIVACLFFVLFSACNEDKDGIPDVLSDNCEMPNGHLKWNFGSNSSCANASLFGDLAIVLTVNGISLSGETLTLELDDVATGNYSISGDTNHLLLTDQLGMAWESSNSNPGTLTILSNNTSSNKLEATFNAQLKNPLGLSKTLSSGILKITYTE